MVVKKSNNIGLIALALSMYASTMLLAGHISTTVEHVAEEQSRIAIEMLKTKMDQSFERLARKCTK